MRRALITARDLSGGKRDRIVLSELGAQSTTSLRRLAFVEIGDVDGDAIPDWAIGDPRGASGGGRVLIVSSHDGTTLDEIALGEDGSELGASLAYEGGRLFVGAPSARDASDREVGAVIAVDLLAGRARQVFTAYGDQEGAELGRSIAVIDGEDGPRVVVGAPGMDAGGRADTGGALVLDGSGLRVSTLHGASTGERAGTTVAVLDRGGQIALGADAADAGRGAVLLFDAAGGLRARVTGSSARERFGTALAAFDADGDGLEELIVGAPGAYEGEGALAVVTAAGKLATRTLGGISGGEAGSTLSVVERNGHRELVVQLPGAALSTSRGGWISLQAP